MLYAISWIIVASLLALWSLAVWALHTVAVWAVSSAGALSGAAAGVETLRLPHWLASWAPPEVAQTITAMLSDLEPLVDSLLHSVPALAGGVSTGLWLLWAVGAALLVLVGVVAHGLTAIWRRKAGGGGLPPSRAVMSS
jgi:hypothetical protein